MPIGHKDNPVRAVRAAMEFNAAIAKTSLEYVAILGRVFSMHNGIDTGLVITPTKESAK